MERLAGQDPARRIYLDNAATSFPKPEGVAEAVARFIADCGGNPGRGAHSASMQASEIVYACRCKLSRLFEGEGAGQVCFVMNTTQALNVGICGLLRHGDHVLISDMEHNSVYRPIYAMKHAGHISFDIFPCLAIEGENREERICAEILGRIRSNTAMLVLNGASNLVSKTAPLEAIGRICNRRGILFVVDGAQLAGHEPISMKKMGIDLLCVPGHKGLLGPQGVGAMIMREGVRPRVMLRGGNGVGSLSAEMGEDMPERYEAGTLPVPAIAGLLCGLEYLERVGVESVREHERALFCRARDGLTGIAGLTLYRADAPGAILSFVLDGMPCERLAELMDMQGICLRGGYHCAALAHRTLRTLETGLVRASFGAFNTEQDVDALCLALRETAKRRAR